MHESMIQYCRQNLSFPDSFIHRILKKASRDLQLKLFTTCKFFRYRLITIWGIDLNEIWIYGDANLSFGLDGHTRIPLIADNYTIYKDILKVLNQKRIEIKNICNQTAKEIYEFLSLKKLDILCIQTSTYPLDMQYLLPYFVPSIVILDLSAHPIINGNLLEIALKSLPNLESFSFYWQYDISSLTSASKIDRPKKLLHVSIYGLKYYPMVDEVDEFAVKQMTPTSHLNLFFFFEQYVEWTPTFMETSKKHYEIIETVQLFFGAVFR